MSENNLSTYAVARASGGKINANTITRILNGEIKEARKSTLDAIAQGIGVDAEDLYDASAGLDVTMPKRFRVYAEQFDASDLTETEWRFIENYFKDTVESFKTQRAHQRQFGAMIASKLETLDSTADRELTKIAQAELRRSNAVPRITGPDPDITPDDAQRMIDAVEIAPRKKKAG